MLFADEVSEVNNIDDPTWCLAVELDAVVSGIYSDGFKEQLRGLVRYGVTYICGHLAPRAPLDK